MNSGPYVFWGAGLAVLAVLALLIYLYFGPLIEYRAS